MMPQGGGGYPGIRAGEMLELAASCARTPLDSRWLLDTLGLAEVVGTKYRRLSGGQKQRLSLACALVGRPEVVFLDEPTEGLDPAGRELVWDLVRCLRGDGVAVVLTTHAIEEAAELADHVTIIDHGRVIASGNPSEVARGDAEDELTFSAPNGLDLDPLRAMVGRRFVIEELVPGSYRVRGAVSPAVVEAVTRWGVSAGVLLSGLNISRNTLERAFLDLTGREVRVG